MLRRSFSRTCHVVWKPKWLRRGGFLSAVRVVGTYLCCGTLLEVAVVVTQQIARVPRASGVFAGSLGGEGMALWVGPAVFLFSMVSTSCQSPQIFRWFVVFDNKSPLPSVRVLVCGVVSVPVLGCGV